jgi:hypothetical protein
MHIHGVYWGTMDDISSRMGWNVLAMDATANWDGLVGSDKVQNSAIVVYPQSTPSPYEDTSRRMVRQKTRRGGGWQLFEMYSTDAQHVLRALHEVMLLAGRGLLTSRAKRGSPHIPAQPLRLPSPLLFLCWC